MIYDQDIIVKAEPEVVRQRAEDFMAKNRYEKHKQGLLKTMEFERGALGANWFTVSPRLWRTLAKIYVYGTDDGKCKVTVQWSIATMGQLVANWEVEYWRAELDQMERALTTGQFEVEPVEKLAQRSYIRSTLLFVVAAAFAASITFLVWIFTQNIKWCIAAFLASILLIMLPFRAWQGLRSIKAAGFNR